MTLVMGGVGALGLLILTVAGLADLVMAFTIGRNRAPVAAARPVQAIDPQTQARLTELIEHGNKIQAIKDLREASGLGLRESMYAVDAMAAGHDISGAFLPGPEVLATTEERARKLVAQGRTIQAIILIREEMGLGLKEAKEAVDGLT